MITHNSSFEYLKDGKVRLNVYCNGEMITHDFPNIEMLEKYYKSATTEKENDICSV